MRGVASRTVSLAVALFLAVFFAAEVMAAEPFPPHVAAAEALQAPVKVGEEKTILAGEPATVFWHGERLEIPPQDRNRITAITFGGSVFSPRQGDVRVFPMAAGYVRRVWEDARTRDLIAVFVNDLEYDRKLSGKIELVTRFENETLPFGQPVIIDDRAVTETSARWGTILGAVGPGIRIPVAPWQVDNDLRVQLLGRGGYFYAGRTNDTGASQLLPPDTFLYGATLRARYDGMRRNLLELPHSGVAAGIDVDFLHRDRWGPLLQGGSVNGEFTQIAAYFAGAGGIPGLSQRNRLLFNVNAGKTLGGGDRFNAFRINGGPFQGEADEVARPRFQGTIFDDALVTDYALASVAYRRELFFFMYLTVEGAYIAAHRAAVDKQVQVVFESRRGTAATIGLDTAFLWNSEIYLAYAWDSGFIRGGRSGSGVILNWTFCF